MSFDSAALLMIAVALAVLAAGIVWYRRPALPRLSLGLAGLGMLLLCLAAGGPAWHRSEKRPLLVLVDCSPSTRGAEFRSRRNLDRRIGQLLGGLRYRIEYFADGRADDPGGGAAIADAVVERTVLPPDPSAEAVLLFSDCRFALPAAYPPAYIVLDSGLENVADGAVQRLDIAAGRASIAVHNTGQPRPLLLRGIEGVSPTTAPAGDILLSPKVSRGAVEIAAQLAPGDAWPENDALTAYAPPPTRGEQWFVGAGDAPSSWTAFTPQSLPADAERYLAPSVIVLANVSAGELDEARQARLLQYVRDLGGSVVLWGGDRAFAAGGYTGSSLETLSPLASHPPRPTTHWMLLADGSGSMASAASAGGGSKWSAATGALVQLLPHLPPDDLISVGSFAERLDWWSFGTSVRQTRSMTLPPPGAGPHGPTNLEPVLKEIAASADDSLSKQLLVLTDADAQIDHSADLAAAMLKKHIRLHLLAIGEGSGLPALKQIIEATGGTLVKQLDAQKWAAAATELMQSASPTLLLTQPVLVRFSGPLAGLRARTVSPWNRTWLKAAAEALGSAPGESENPPMAARWQIGEGTVLAAAFDARRELEAMVQLVAGKPRDPRFTVSWETGPSLRVNIKAADADHYLNDLKLSMSIQSQVGSEPPATRVVPQVGPGEYALGVESPRTASFVTMRTGGMILDQIAVAGRYAPEFDAVGNDHEAMLELARRTGGQVIDLNQTRPIDFHWPTRKIPLISFLAGAGALLIGAGLAWWRLS